ncbi:MAG TPA: hypothetical protein VEU96_18685 [Bryobacteraceae bacterium]|nr:hypothetical protein [Bryobacteraceae bacterium]
MRSSAGKVLILLAIAMALANARCFSHCLVQPCGQQGSMPCHSHGKPDSNGCAHHHDLTAAGEASVQAPGECLVDFTAAPVVDELQVSRGTVVEADPSPPWSSGVIATLPLRI